MTPTPAINPASECWRPKPAVRRAAEGGEKELSRESQEEGTMTVTTEWLKLAGFIEDCDQGCWQVEAFSRGLDGHRYPGTALGIEMIVGAEFHIIILRGHRSLPAR